MQLLKDGQPLPEHLLPPPPKKEEGKAKKGGKEGAGARKK